MIGVYVVVDPDVCRGRSPVDVARAALRGGASRIQLRAKRACDRDRLAWAEALARLCREHERPFVVNDRPDLALLVGADEVHVGQDDLPVEAVRRIVPGVSVARSTHDQDQLRRAVAEGADRVAFGPVFATQSKERPDPVVGVAGLEAALAIAGRPLIAIGGLDVPRARSLRALPLAEIAVISAVCAADDPEAATARLQEALC
ncbi:MAG: thiamine phosphate synthase [Sandaracinaceae bacterium]